MNSPTQGMWTCRHNVDGRDWCLQCYSTEDDEGDTFPVVCENGCPEGYLGRHKFSCSLARPGKAQ